MSKGIYDFGSGLGWIYVVQPDGTTIVDSLRNTPANAKKTKLTAVEAMSVALNRKANGTITVATVTGVGNITDITINGVSQIDTSSPIPFTGATSVSALAALINTAVNTYGDPASPTYETIVSGATITFIAPESIGADDNGQTITVTISANATTTGVAVNNGSDATELYDLGYGYRFFLDADYGTTGCAGTGVATPSSLTNSVEITNSLIQRGLNSAIDVQNATISSGVISFTRKSVDTLIYIDTESSAVTDELDTINPAGFADGDKITLRGVSGSRVTTVTDNSGNIQLQGSVDFATGATETALVLQLKNSIWYELSRTTQSLGVTADYRTAGFGFFGIDTYNTAAVGTSGTTTFTAGTDSKYQSLTGSGTLVGALHYQLGIPGAVAGDEMWLVYNASVAKGANAMSIFGITLTADQALAGGLLFHAKFESGAWYSSVSANLDSGVTYPYTIPTELYKALSVTVAKVEATLSTEVITRRVSFETGEQCANKIKMPYPGTVVEAYFVVDKVIAGTDDGTITPKNNAGTSMTGGLITVTAASALDTGFTSTITGNNTFIAGDILSFTTAKTTAGGFGTLSIKITKS